jgi:hypothetical protein
MGSSATRFERVFKTAWFAKVARKMSVRDDELCRAICEVMLGRSVDLGGGVFKKRLDKNRARSIIVAKSRRFWVYVYLFSKQDRANTSDRELKSFRELADVYARKTNADIAKELEIEELVEICNGHQA